jgi:hypothetical protein
MTNKITAVIGISTANAAMPKSWISSMRISSALRRVPDGLRELVALAAGKQAGRPTHRH